MSTLGDVLATVAMLWCSATQNRTNPSRSAARASSVVSCSASPEVPPSRTTERSRTDRCITPSTLRRCAASTAARRTTRIRLIVAAAVGPGGSRVRGMAIRKVCGIDTDYGIVVRGADNNPVTASSLLINAYVNATSKKVGWDFEDESPANDARGFNLDDVFPPEVESSLVNAVLPNGARYYVDHAHPEISLPEVTNALDLVRWDRAADEIIRSSM